MVTYTFFSKIASLDGTLPATPKQTEARNDVSGDIEGDFGRRWTSGGPGESPTRPIDIWSLRRFFENQEKSSIFIDFALEIL